MFQLFNYSLFEKKNESKKLLLKIDMKFLYG